MHLNEASDETREGRVKEESLLDQCRKGERNKGELGVIAFQLPGLGLLRFVSGSRDPSVLTEARRDDYGRFVLKEAVDLPTFRSVIYPVMISFHYERVEKFEVLKV